MKIKATFIFFILFSIFCNRAFTEVTSVNVGEGSLVKGPTHWIRIEPEKPTIKLEILTDKDTFHIGEIVTIKFRIKNISDAAQEIDLSNISICGFDKTFKNSIFFQKSLKKLNGKIRLTKGDSVINEVILDNLYKITKPEIFIVWAYYNLPNDKGINSNDLKIIIEP